MLPSRVISVLIDRPWSEVYDFLVDPANIPSWMPMIGPTLRRLSNTEWVADEPVWPVGPIHLRFTPRNSFGVLDCQATTGRGDSRLVPIRLVPNGRGCELIYLMRRDEEMSAEAFSSEAEWLLADLLALKSMLESRES